jgi:hypothetical protein
MIVAEIHWICICGNELIFKANLAKNILKQCDQCHKDYVIDFRISDKSFKEKPLPKSAIYSSEPKPKAKWANKWVRHPI